MLIGELLTKSAKKFPNKLAVICDTESVSYTELEYSSNRLARALIRENIGRGHNIGIYSTNQIEYPTIFFGAAKSGCVLAHLSVRFSNEELQNVINNTDIEALFVHSNFLENVLDVVPNAPKLKRIIVFGSLVKVRNGVESLETFIGNESESIPNIDIVDTDPFGITFTGGTTGFPKGVVVSHKSRIIGSVRAEREMELEINDIMCCSSPLFHIAGLFIWFQTGILMGLTSVLMQAWDPLVFQDLVQQHGISAAFMVPTQINSIISNEGFDPGKLQGLRYINYGASPTSPAQLQKQIDALPHVVWQEQYGQSEAGNLTVRPSKFNMSKSGSVGRPYSDLELSIFDRDNKRLPPGDIGEIVTRGVHVMLNYYGDPAQTREISAGNGWIKTGDVGYLDVDGFLFLVDRSKDLIISGGENIFPAEIENALYRHKAVNECAVFGIPDDYWGELPAAHIVLESGNVVNELELSEFCTKIIGRHKRPRLIKFVDRLPKSAVGKIQKSKIKEPYWREYDTNTSKSLD
ncbi:MAG: class I adenylate-forming enzyme family protein [Pseudomonadota bacterium]|nr:class I adenylate-forming enzyme family protein [Pseudomonadota bacterium]